MYIMCEPCDVDEAAACRWTRRVEFDISVYRHVHIAFSCDVICAEIILRTFCVAHVVERSFVKQIKFANERIGLIRCCDLRSAKCRPTQVETRMGV
jgi:hypothetical protein